MEKRKCPKYGRGYMLRNVPLIILLAVLFYVSFARAWLGRTDVIFWISLTLFVGVIVVGFFYDRVRLASFYCPLCKELLPHPTIEHRKEGDPINFHCERCDIEWETGLSESED